MRFNKILITPLTTDAAMTAIIASSWSFGSSKASSAIKIATVKPIPAALPVASSENFPERLGASAKFKLVAIFVNKSMPSGFPKTIPKKIPKATTDVKAELMADFDISIPVFASANNGTIK